MQKIPALAVRSVTEQVQEALIGAIVGGQLAPNETLSDRQISEKLGVSRTPVREAFHHLEAAGLLKRRARIGWTVADLNRRDVEEMFELRILLEAAGIRRVVGWSDDELDRLVTHFDGLELPFDARTTTAYLKKDEDFHNLLIRATENSRITETYQVVKWQVHRVRHFVSYRALGRVQQSLEEHRRICRALAARDAVHATEALEEHLTHVQEKFVELLGTTEQPKSGKGGSGM